MIGYYLRLVLYRAITALQFISMGVLVGFLYFWLAKKRSWKRLAAEADSLGLEHTPARSYSDFGTLEGKVNGYRMTVKIEKFVGVRVTVELHTKEKMLEFRTWRPDSRPETGWSHFETEDSFFNSMWKTRLIKVDYKERFVGDGELIARIAGFYRKWMFRLVRDMGTLGFDIDGREISCCVGAGLMGELYPSVSPETLKKLLDDLAELANQFDSSIRGHSGSRK